MCALVEAIKVSMARSGTRNATLIAILSEWECKATKARDKLPLGEFSWSEILRDISPNEKHLNSYTNEPGIVRWTPSLEAPSSSAAIRGLGVSWNVNGLRPRLRNGDFQRLIDDRQPEYLHITELRSNVLSLGRPWELRRALAAQGYTWCIFNYCVFKSPKGNNMSGNWVARSSAVFDPYR